VINLLRKHVDRDPPEMVSRICGTPHDKYSQVYELFATTAAPDKALTCLFALGCTLAFGRFSEHPYHGDAPTAARQHVDFWRKAGIRQNTESAKCQ
jgi:hypothetical protein